MRKVVALGTHAYARIIHTDYVFFPSHPSPHRQTSQNQTSPVKDLKKLILHLTEVFLPQHSKRMLRFGTARPAERNPSPTTLCLTVR